MKNKKRPSTPFKSERSRFKKARFRIILSKLNFCALFTSCYFALFSIRFKKSEIVASSQSMRLRLITLNDAISFSKLWIKWAVGAIIYVDERSDYPLRKSSKLIIICCFSEMTSFKFWSSNTLEFSVEQKTIWDRRLWDNRPLIGWKLR